MPIIVAGLFAAGLCLGSFCNVVIARSVAALQSSQALPHTFGGRSRCPHCQKQLRWWELIPLLSFIFLRGRCHRCRAEISVQYPVVELTMGIFTLLVSYPLPLALSDAGVFILKVAIIALLIILFVIDLKTMYLPDRFVLALFVSVVIYLLLTTHYSLTRALGGAAITTGFLFLIWLLTRGRGLGFGDVKLAVPLGLLFGPLGATALLWLAYGSGGVLAIYLLLRRKATLKTALPFGPFLCGAALVLVVVPDLPNHLITLLLGYNPWPQ